MLLCRLAPRFLPHPDNSACTNRTRCTYGLHCSSCSSVLYSAAFQISLQKNCIWSTVTANNITGKCIDAVQKLALQWKNQPIQLKPLNASTKAVFLSAFKTTGAQPAPAFGMGGQQTSSFGLSSFPVSSSSTSASSFSFKTSSSLISSASSGSSSSAAANPPAFGTTSSPSAPQSTGFGSPAAPSAASFSFKTAATAAGFGTPGFSGFGSAAAVNSASTTPLPAFSATVLNNILKC
ncbi:nucleoporin NUP42-like isoform X1 [Sylvia atricapilla]|uniref:nucleoporin NUP42-like isoform X1 n=1 Tax=Sylvia atricapilla TaxID=48155 RepID=UPI003393E247